MISDFFFPRRLWIRNVDFAENRISDPKMVVGAPEIGQRWKFCKYDFSFPFHHSLQNLSHEYPVVLKLDRPKRKHHVFL